MEQIIEKLFGAADKITWTNYYRCPCGEEWNDQWDCCCNDHCPKCHKEIEPYISDDGPRSAEEIENARLAAIANQ